MPLNTTFEILSKSRNDAAVPVLIGGLDNPDGTIHEAALRALVSRRNRGGHLAVLSRWHLFSESQRDLVSEGRGKMSAGLRDALLAEDDQIFQNACEVIERFREFHLVSTLVTLAENKGHPHAARATSLVLRMVSLLSEMIHGRRDANDRRDPHAIRRHLLESLERSVERFREHQRAELIEAFVVLGGASSGLLRTIIEDPHHACYLTVAHTLSTSQSTAVVELLLGFLEVEHVSMASLTVISKRADQVFIKHLLKFVDDRLTPRAEKNLSRIHNFAWLNDSDRKLADFDEVDQVRCVTLLSCSGLKQQQVLGLLEELLQTGQPAGRAAACAALASLPGDQSNHLVLEAVKDPDPGVQAAAARQLRERRLTSAMSLLTQLLDSPHEIVREAARESLSEYSLENFLLQYDSLHDDMRRVTAALVTKVDTGLVRKLGAELASTSRKNRLRAIELAELMGQAVQMADGLVDCLADDDHLVRAAAAEALQFCPTAKVREALQYATADRSTAVQTAAKSSLATFARLNLARTSAAAKEGSV